MLFTVWETGRESDGVCAEGRQGGCGAMGCDMQKREGTQVEALLCNSPAHTQPLLSLSSLSGLGI